MKKTTALKLNKGKALHADTLLCMCRKTDSPQTVSVLPAENQSAKP